MKKIVDMNSKYKLHISIPSHIDFDLYKQLIPMQLGDLPTTYADTTALERDFGFTPQISLREGLRKSAQWYSDFYC